MKISGFLSIKQEESVISCCGWKTSGPPQMDVTAMAKSMAAVDGNN